MKKSINILAVAVLISTVNFNVKAEGAKNAVAVDAVLPAVIEVSEIAAPELARPVAQTIYTAAQKAAQVELDFVRQKQNVLRIEDVLVDSIPAIEVEVPAAGQAWTAERAYTPAQKIALVELSF